MDASPISIHWRRTKLKRVSNYKTHPRHTLRVDVTDLIAGWNPYDTNTRRVRGHASSINKKSETSSRGRMKLKVWLRPYATVPNSVEQCQPVLKVGVLGRDKVWLRPYRATLSPLPMSEMHFILARRRFNYRLGSLWH
jgi:hypothetical protein